LGNGISPPTWGLSHFYLKSTIPAWRPRRRLVYGTEKEGMSMFEAVIVTGNTEPLEMNMSGSRVTVKWTKETGFTVTLVSKDTETRFNSKFDMIRVAVENNDPDVNTVMVTNEYNEFRNTLGYIEKSNYADLTINPSVIQVNNDLFTEVRIAIYPK